MSINFDTLSKAIGPINKSATYLEELEDATEAVPEFSLDDDGEEYTGVGIRGLLASSEKLLAINRGLVEPDERDSIRYKKLHRGHSLFKERIKMDAGKLARQGMYRVAASSNLNHFVPGYFDPYIMGQIVGNSLAAPLEEINPMHLVEASRRITQMGPGGLGSDRSITTDAQAVHPSQFGFISPIESPESARAGIDTRLAHGTRIGSNGRIFQVFDNPKTNRRTWLSPEDVANRIIGLPE